MITTFKNKVPGGFLITAYWMQNIRPRVINKFTTDETRAENLVLKMKKEILREKMLKVLNHRSQIINNYGGLRTETKFNAIEQLKRNFDFLADKSLESNCKLIIDSEELLKELIPGLSSIFHQSTKETIFEILNFCKLQITI